MGKLKPKNIEMFCDLCFARIKLDMEYRMLQHGNHQLLNITRPMSRSYNEAEWHSKDPLGMGQVLERQPKKPKPEPDDD